MTNLFSSAAVGVVIVPVVLSFANVAVFTLKLTVAGLSAVFAVTVAVVLVPLTKSTASVAPISPTSEPLPFNFQPVFTAVVS